MPILTAPLALLGLLALPAVAAIYLLRNRSRRYTVSSLMLWADQRRAREGGLQVQRIQTPLLLLLELLVLALLALAASDPRIRRDVAQRPLVVVLDDSYSMLATQGDGDSKTTARARAEEALADLLEDEGDTTVRMILAGSQMQLLGEPTRIPAQAIGQLKGWTCGSPDARLVEGVAMAMAVGGSTCRVLVLTDHPRPDELLPEAPEGGRLLWRALGAAKPNIAIVGASRTAIDFGPVDTATPRRVLLEVANLWDHPRTAKITVDGLDDSGAPKALSMQLSGQEVRRLPLEVTGKPKPIRIRTAEDALAIDNEVLLLPRVRQAVRVKIDITHAAVRDAVTRALAATDSAVITATRAALEFTDKPPASATGGAWPVQLLSEPGAVAYAGPYVLDRSHGVVEGLELGGVIWGAGKDKTLPGRPIVTVGNVPLVSDAQRPSGVHELRIRMNPAVSTLIDTPNWPILIWNILRFRAADMPALQQANVRLGTPAVLRVRPGTNQLKITIPNGNEQTRTLRDRTASIPARQVGVYTVVAGMQTYRFSANALYQDESDISRCDTADGGTWLNDTVLQTEYRSIAWICLLAALAGMIAHMVLTSLRPGGSRL